MGHPYHYNSHHEAAAAAHGTTPRMRCSFKRATAVVCGGNLVVLLYLLHSLLVPLYIRPGASHSSIVLIRQNGTLMPTVMKYTQAQLYRIKEANKARQAAQPLKLIERVKELQQESQVVAMDSSAENAAAVLSHHFKEKLYFDHFQEEVPFVDEVALVEASNTFIEEEGSGLLPSRSEIEDGIIPGRPLPEECHAEAHTDYDGAAVRWGLTHHVDSAADCCQACLDQARSAEGDSKKCNVWVYCPSEEGCFSPDIYEHKHQECWLKQSDEPKLNFKGRYDEEYRNDHPNAPIVVPWVAGVIQ
ncbi:hypothetical protein CY35_13G003000 [Sphagnum magellanicum]|nr:hypothetical protein CY35_13G003000 [Sphagnum magellanicum]